MTTEELRYEWQYCFEERIGMMCGTNEPTADQLAIAFQEADEAIEVLKQEN